MRYLRMKSWSPYVVGSLIGMLSWWTFASADRALGISTAIARTAGMAASVAAPEHVSQNAYFSKFKPGIDWEWMLVLGVAIGAFVSSRLSGDRPPTSPEPLWQSRFGPSLKKRLLAAAAGGVLLMFGARLAGGCTSGHGISGSLQLALSGWVFFASVFAAGMATAYLLFVKGAARG
jgi:uncharacterized protein